MKIGIFLFQKLVDAQDFYTKEEIRLTALVEEEKSVALSKRLGIAFVTLGNKFSKFSKGNFFFILFAKLKKKGRRF